MTRENGLQYNQKQNDNVFIENLNSECEKNTGNDRRIKELKDKNGTIIVRLDRVRELPQSENENTGGRIFWYIIDFDDVINNTTGLNNDFKKRLEEMIGLSPKKYDEIYNSFSGGPSGGGTVQLNAILKKILKFYPGREEKINKVFGSLDFNSYIDGYLKRVIAMLHSTINPNDSVHVTILTYGEYSYQKGKIDSTDIEDVVHDIAYTEGSKKEAVETLADEFYKIGDITNTDTASRPIIITVDDNPRHVDDLAGLNIGQHLNILLQNPRIKRFGMEAKTKNAIRIIENAPHQGAYAIYKIKQLLEKQGGEDISIEEIRKEIKGASFSPEEKLIKKYK